MRKRFVNFSIALWVVIPFIVGGCLMNDAEDIPDFSEQLQKDLKTIDDYLAANQIDATSDPDGLIRYVIHRDSTGHKPGIDSCVTTNYVGKLMSNGQTFDDGENISFPLRTVIDGWKIGIPLMDIGDSVTFYIPSGLAYGYRGFPPVIPSNANLIFSVGLTDIGKSYKSSGTDSSCD